MASDKILTAKFFLVRQLNLSNRHAEAILESGAFKVNRSSVDGNFRIYPADELSLNGQIVRTGKKLVYLALYKPRGIESTMNQGIGDNLLTILPDIEGLFPVGRLDKESEGLMLFTNDGHLYKDLALSDANKEKEYVVELDKSISDHDLNLLSEGVIIMGKMTRKAQVIRHDDKSFNIILTQGLNRQIRRMCYKLGYEVTFLKRIRIDQLVLGDLKPGRYRLLQESEINKLVRYRK